MFGSARGVGQASREELAATVGPKMADKIWANLHNSLQ